MKGVLFTEIHAYTINEPVCFVFSKFNFRRLSEMRLLEAF
jgi:hypothetical protein